MKSEYWGHYLMGETSVYIELIILLIIQHTFKVIDVIIERGLSFISTLTPPPF